MVVFIVHLTEIEPFRRRDRVRWTRRRQVHFLDYSVIALVFTFINRAFVALQPDPHDQ
ncbi:hypothetical protein ACWIGI_33720 [Nocardia sp. NPDC055321]